MSDRKFTANVRDYVNEPGTYTGTVTGARNDADAEAIVNRELGKQGYTTVGPVEIEKKN